MGLQIIVIGGGAAGFFGAIHAAEHFPDSHVTILERAAEVLGKVKISGGGRCNVCHAEYDPRVLSKSYPRGAKALLGPFNRFCTGDTIAWYAERGVALKTEDDGRMFPVTDDSQTIVDCLRRAASQAGVQVRTQVNVRDIRPHEGRWQVETTSDTLTADRVLVAPGSSQHIWDIFARLGHTIESPVPSLFTFNIRDPRLADIPGIAVPGAVSVPGTALREQGPVLITHWGLSGPAILRLSAWGARDLHARGYQFKLLVHWVPGTRVEEMFQALAGMRKDHPKKTAQAQSAFGLPNRLWRKLCTAAGIGEALNWADTNNAQLKALATELCEGSYAVTGKSTFKDEFVTCGGIRLDEVNFKTMESKRLPGIFFAGEVMDIDAITGGFNFQAAWTTSAIAGMSIGLAGA